MSDLALSMESVSKLYRLGQVGTGTLAHDLNRWWARITGKEDPIRLTPKAKKISPEQEGISW